MIQLGSLVVCKDTIGKGHYGIGEVEYLLGEALAVVNFKKVKKKEKCKLDELVLYVNREVEVTEERYKEVAGAVLQEMLEEVPQEEIGFVYSVGKALISGIQVKIFEGED